MSHKEEAIALAGRIGEHLEGENVLVCGLALGIIVGRLSHLFGPDIDTRCEGIDAIMEDAKAAAAVGLEKAH